MWNALWLLLFLPGIWTEYNFTYSSFETTLIVALLYLYIYKVSNLLFPVQQVLPYEDFVGQTLTLSTVSLDVVLKIITVAHRCKQHISSNGYHYSPFYRVTEVTPLDAGTVFEMHLAILAASNGHILLSPIENPGISDPVYEIVLGGGANKFSELRRMQKRGTKISERTVGILSPIHFRAFWIRITDDGTVDVGREGESIAFLHYNDPDPLSVNYFSFASWTNVEAKFLYDCPVAGDDAVENVTKSEVILPKLTTAQRLKVALLGDRSPLTPPAPRVTVRLTLSAAGVRYDGSVLNTLLGITLSWKDEQMVWNPDNYNGTTTLLLRQSEIWKPEFYVHNSVGIGELAPTVTEPVYILNSGIAILHLRSQVSAWCEDKSGSFSWPRDEYKCNLYIGPWEMHEQIHMEVLDDNSKENAENTLENAFLENEWELVSAGYMLNSSAISPYSNVTCYGGEYAQTNTLLVLRLQIRRRGAISTVLYTPLITVAVFQLMSFWWEALTHSQHRVHLYSAICVLLIALLSYFDALPPGHTLPSIMMLYQVVLLTTLLALVAQLLLMKREWVERYLSWLRSLLSSPALSFVCCLPHVQAYKSFSSEMDEETLEASCSTADLHNLGTEPRSSRKEDGGAHQALAAIVDRIMFSFCLLLYAILLATLHNI